RTHDVCFPGTRVVDRSKPPAVRAAAVPGRLGRATEGCGFVTRLRIAMVSEHASPLAMLGGVDAGGQNTHVAELATALGRNGHSVRVYTGRDDRDLRETVTLAPRVRVVHVPAGPPGPVPKDELLPFMGDFGRWLTAEWESSRFNPDVVHAHFWMSG